MCSDVIASYPDQRMVSKNIPTYPLFWLIQLYEKYGKAGPDMSVSQGLQQVCKCWEKTGFECMELGPNFENIFKHPMCKIVREIFGFHLHIVQI